MHQIRIGEEQPREQKMGRRKRDEKKGEKIRVLPMGRRCIRSLSKTGSGSYSLLVLSLDSMPSLTVLDGVAVGGH
jgi:hypothetical protein